MQVKVIGVLVEMIMMLNKELPTMFSWMRVIIYLELGIIISFLYKEGELHSLISLPGIVHVHR